MKKSIEIYALIISAISLLIFMISFGMATYNLIRVTYPKATFFNNQIYQTNASYLANQRADSYGDPKKVATLAKLSDQQITQQRLFEYQNRLDNERQLGINNLIPQSISAILSLLVFLLHWRLARKTNPST